MLDLDLGRLGYAERGLFDSFAAYAPRDVVTWQGSTYRCLAPAEAGQTPVSHPEKWVLMARGTMPLYTEKGDLLTFDGTDAVRLGIGGQGQVLGVRDGLPRWQANPSRPGSTVAALACNPLGSSMSLGALPVVMSDGTVKIWGGANNMCNGDFTNATVAAPQHVAFDPLNAPLYPIVQVAFCCNTGYALDSAGRVYAWGWNGHGQLGLGDTAPRNVATQIAWFAEHDVRIKSVIVPRESDETLGGSGAAFFLSVEGLVYACGYNGQGQLGNGSAASSSLPVRCGTIAGIVQVFVSGANTAAVYAIDKSGNLYAWGCNNHGQLGLGDKKDRLSPQLVPNISKAAKVACSSGAMHNGAWNFYGSAMALCADGSLYVTGYNGYGQLGLGHTDSVDAFQKLILGFTPASVELYGGHYASSWIVDTQGRLWTAGYNGHGQLGNGSTTNTVSFMNVGAGAPWDGKAVRLTAGGGSWRVAASSAALQDQSGALWTFGCNKAGQLGVGNTTPSISVPTLVVSARPSSQMDIVDFTWGGFYGDYGRLWVLTADGRLWGAGNNGEYSLGTHFAPYHAETRLVEIPF